MYHMLQLLIILYFANEMYLWVSYDSNEQQLFP